MTKHDKTLTAAAAKAIPEKAITPDGKIDWEHLDVDIERHGTKITLPSDPDQMPIRDAIVALKRKLKDDESELHAHEIIDAYPYDGAVALVRALKIKYGWANSVPTPGFFGPKPPQMLTIETGPRPEDKVQCPWGGFQLPNVEHPIHTAFDWQGDGQGPRLVIYGTVRKREHYIIKEIADLTRQLVKEHSIYRGRAIRLRCHDHDGTIDFDKAPKFLDTSGALPEELILPRNVEAQVRTNIWTLIERTQDCRDAKIPIKRGVLLSGPYGTGKTLTSRLTARVATENDWTFITIDRAAGLAQALEFAKRYQPCVIFAEDIDRATEERNEHANDLLNILDGVLSKDAEVLVVLTTNHVEKINRAMLRPGRLDAVINVTPPDAEAVGRLIHVYSRGRLVDGTSLDRIGKALEGQIPATIREVVERSKLGAFAAKREDISEDDLLLAAEAMGPHLNLLNHIEEKDVSSERKYGDALTAVVDERIADAIKNNRVLRGLEAYLNDAGDYIPD